LSERTSTHVVPVIFIVRHADEAWDYTSLSSHPQACALVSLLPNKPLSSTTVWHSDSVSIAWLKSPIIRNMLNWPQYWRALSSNKAFRDSDITDNPDLPWQPAVASRNQCVPHS
jgi:hypothetical protein